MVLDAGRIVRCSMSPSLTFADVWAQVEFDKPSELLKNEKGFLRQLVEESADKEKLVAMANGY